MKRYPHILRLLPILFSVFIFAVPAVSSSPVQALGRLEDDRLYPGTYNGTFIFTIEHTYNKPTQDMPTNYYSLRAEDAVGLMRFRANEYGVVAGVQIRFSPFRYNAVNSQFLKVPEGSQGEYHCTGNNAYAAGVGTASGGSGLSGAPPLNPTPRDFWTKPVKLDSGDPFGQVSLIGKCPGKADRNVFINAVKLDINSLPATRWIFTVTWTGYASAGGTCSTESWTTANRSITCYWAAYTGGYKRKTAPGP